MHNLGPLTGLVAVVMLFGIPITAVVCNAATVAWKAWLDVGLKRDMIARGYTADEIVAVLAAKRGSKPDSTLPNVPPAKPIKQPVYSS
jgi:hypothetical protein